MDEDKTDEDDNITEGIWGTPIHRDEKHKEDTASAKQRSTQAKPTTNSSMPPSQETCKTGPSKENKKTSTAPPQNADKPVPKPRTARTPKTQKKALLPLTRMTLIVKTNVWRNPAPTNKHNTLPL